MLARESIVDLKDVIIRVRSGFDNYKWLSFIGESIP